MKHNTKAFAIPAIVWGIGAAAAVALWFAGKIHIPFVETKAQVQAELNVEKAKHKLTQADLAAANALADKQAKLLLDQDVAAAKQKTLTQSAANSNAKITAVYQIVPPVVRKDVVINNAAAETAAALPTPTDYAAILQVVKDQLDELKTSNAQLAATHTADLNTIDIKQHALDQALKEVQAQQNEVTKQQKVNADQKIANDAQLKVLDSKEASINGLMAELDKFKYMIMGLIGLAGVLAIAAGALLSNKTMLAGGVALAILAVVGMIIPLMWYLIAMGIALVGVVAYVVKEWHKEKTIGDNAVGILQETKVAAPAFWNSTVKPIAKTYWGTTVKEVAKADAWVGAKLKDMNFLPKTDAQPAPVTVIPPTPPAPTPAVPTSVST